MKQVGKHHVPAPYAPNKALQVRLYLANARTVNFPAFAPGGPASQVSRSTPYRQKFLRFSGKAYCNGDADCEAFDGRLEFKVKIIAYTGSDAWVEQAIRDAHACLMAEVLPEASTMCEYCCYRRAAATVEGTS